MLFDLPDHATMHAALLARDASWEGRAYVCVSTTGIFCRLTCPARKPLPENCSFHATVAECMEAGFRPCKRCRPLAKAGAEPAVTELLAMLEADPGRRWRERDLIAAGYDPSTLRRTFRRHFGMTFLEMARLRRLREGFAALEQGGKVIAAQLDAGFESASAFRAAFARLLGRAPGELRAGQLLSASWIPTPLGDMIAVASASHLHLLEFAGRKALPAELRQLETEARGPVGLGRTDPLDQAAEELARYFGGQDAIFATPLAPGGTAFSRQVWAALRRIPAGETRSYGDLAREIGRPEAVRAVARANGANRIAVMIPCHRVIGADGSLTGYGGGLWRKQRLIEIEAALRGGRAPEGAPERLGDGR
ncbi:bifunctional transcriptional activator/DNA repair enzyme AdaA [Mangrovicoccus sp. HB161399]|uniref:bifunctional transcriptional activator/DNA repair enzyme AdaA n=1 Tax=Mangrovicoccus sp. HB161399 TaxID=2720392 RepID=UPI0015540463|nr:trifunctional transcriptional activator/DNA repair protein Ada/methylated-DNA--[protein]-cysteine S-methyltransferase [Mangrovicoccus sp. HB161399]